MGDEELSKESSLYTTVAKSNWDNSSLLISLYQVVRLWYERLGASQASLRSVMELG